LVDPKIVAAALARLNGPVPVPTLQARMGLTPQEVNKVTFHRSNMANPLIDRNGNKVTIAATGLEIPEGPNRGKQVSVPGYVGANGFGTVVTNPRDLYMIRRNEIQSGKWPMYSSAAQLNKRDAQLHGIMDHDTAAQDLTHIGTTSDPITAIGAALKQTGKKATPPRAGGIIG